jgi:hypothetical protein
MAASRAARAPLGVMRVPGAPSVASSMSVRMTIHDSD